MKKVNNAIITVLKALYDLHECIIDSNIIDGEPYEMDTNELYNFMKDLSDDCYDAVWSASSDYWWSVFYDHYDYHYSSTPHEEHEIEISYGKKYNDLFINCRIAVKVFYNDDLTGIKAIGIKAKTI